MNLFKEAKGPKVGRLVQFLLFLIEKQFSYLELFRNENILFLAKFLAFRSRKYVFKGYNNIVRANVTNRDVGLK